MILFFSNLKSTVDFWLHQRCFVEVNHFWLENYPFLSGAQFLSYTSLVSGVLFPLTTVTWQNLGTVNFMLWQCACTNGASEISEKFKLQIGPWLGEVVTPGLMLTAAYLHRRHGDLMPSYWKSKGCSVQARPQIWAWITLSKCFCCRSLTCKQKPWIFPFFSTHCFFLFSFRVYCTKSKATLPFRLNLSDWSRSSRCA